MKRVRSSNGVREGGAGARPDGAVPAGAPRAAAPVVPGPPVAAFKHALAHADGEFHHHHTHAPDSHHPGRHHLLTVQRLTVSFDMYDADEPFFRARRRRHEVLHDLTVSVHPGEILAVVGASGAGKTVLADCVMGKYASNEEVPGEIWFDGALMDAVGLARLRGRGISLVPQSVTHRDPLRRVGEQVRGAARGSTRAERAEDARRRAERQRVLFAAYGFDAGVEGLYPHQLSGGMARRILLMCALMEEPRLIIADEPTPGLDLDLAARALSDLRGFADAGGGVLLITHDIELALRVADRVAIVRAGTVVEETARESFESPDLLREPYTRALWHAMPEHGFTSALGEPDGDGAGASCPVGGSALLGTDEALCGAAASRDGIR